MRFGIFYEHQLPRPWGPDAERRLLADALEQVEVADRVGIDTVWAVEHHFLEEYSHSSASDVFLAAASQRAPRIRLGFGILPLPPGYEHPARRAETVAMLDLVSGGRVELGTGETSSGAELAGFGVDRRTKREQWEEAIDVLTRMLVEEPFAGWDGRFVSMPPRNVVPKPVQRPHPPLWVACSRRDTIRLAARRGIGALSFSFVEPEEAKEWVDEYHAILASEQCVPAGFAVNPQVAVVLPMMLHDDEAEAIERGIDGAHFFGYSLAHYYLFGDHRPGRTSIWDEFQRRRQEAGFARSVIRPDKAPLGVKVLQQGLGSLRGAIGTPEQVAELVERYERAGVDQVIFVLQAGNNRHEHIVESLELFGERVLPRFAAGREEREAERAARLAPVVAAALARRAPARTSGVDHVIAPMDSGPPARRGAAPWWTERGAPRGRRSSVAGLVRGVRRDGRSLAAGAAARGEAAFRAFVRGTRDDRLERTAGSDLGLRALFAAMTRRFRPDRAEGFTGAILYDLRTADGAAKPWTVTVGNGRAVARPGRVGAPSLTLRMTVVDFLRLAAGDLDPGKALMTGRLELAGDATVALRLGEMFGAAPAT